MLQETVENILIHQNVFPEEEQKQRKSTFNILGWSLSLHKLQDHVEGFLISYPFLIFSKLFPTTS